MTRETVDLDRVQVLARRCAVQDLADARPVIPVSKLDVLGIGLQDTPAGSAQIGLTARMRDAPAADDPDLVLALTVRGAPHLHRRTDLPFLRAALLPRDTQELATYLGGHGAAVLEAGVNGQELLDEVTATMRSVFPGDTATKGELSAAVSPELPAIARPWCDGCGVDHIAEGLFRIGTLAAGIELVPDGRRLRFRPGPAPGDIDGDGDSDGGELARRFVRLTGPTRPAEVAEWLSTLPPSVGSAVADRLWQAIAPELVEVGVEGRRRWALQDEVAALQAAPPPTVARLLPPRDPFVNGDQQIVFADPANARRVRRATGGPGTILIDGEVVGTWRHRRAGRGLQVELAPFARLPDDRHRQLEEQAGAVARMRGADDVDLTVVDAS